MFDSWNGRRAVSYRRLNGIPESWGTAVNVQQMVFGNRGDDSGSGVAFSRDEITGAPEPSGDFLQNAQGEDVVSGVRNTKGLDEMSRAMPAAHGELIEALGTLERHYRDMQDVEFTVEQERLYLLQTRSAKRPAQAAVRFAVDAVSEGLLEKGEALRTIDAGSRRPAAPDLRPTNTTSLPPIILRTRNAFDVRPIFVECQQPAFLTPLELRVEDFEGKFTDTATNTPVAVVHEKVNVLVRVVVVSGIKGRS